MEVMISQEDDMVNVAVRGRLDAVTAPDFQQQVQSCIDNGRTRFIIDLTALEYISSAGLRSMLFLAKKLKVCRGELALCGLTGMVKEVFAISGFSTILAIYPNAAEAGRQIRTGEPGINQ